MGCMIHGRFGGIAAAGDSGRPSEESAEEEGDPTGSVAFLRSESREVRGSVERFFGWLKGGPKVNGLA